MYAGKTRVGYGALGCFVIGALLLIWSWLAYGQATEFYYQREATFGAGLLISGFMFVAVGILIVYLGKLSPTENEQPKIQPLKNP